MDNVKEFADVTEDMRDRLVLAVQKYKTAKSNLVSAWMLAGEAFAAIIDGRLYRAAFYSNWKNYFTEELNEDTEFVTASVAAYKEFKDSAVAALPFYKVLQLLHAPAEFRKDVKKDKELFNRLNKASSKEFGEKVAAAKRAGKGDNGNAGEKRTDDLFTVLKRQGKNEKRNKGIMNKARIEEEELSLGMKSHLIQFEADINKLLEFADKLGDIQFATALVDENITDKIQQLLWILYIPAQHGELGVDHMKKMVSSLETKIKNDGTKIDIPLYLKNFSPYIEQTRSLIRKFDNLGVKKDEKGNLVQFPRVAKQR